MCPGGKSVKELNNIFLIFGQIRSLEKNSGISVSLSSLLHSFQFLVFLHFKSYNNNVGMVVTQLVKRSLPFAQIPGSNPIIGNFVYY